MIKRRKVILVSALAILLALVAGLALYTQSTAKITTLVIDKMTLDVGEKQDVVFSVGTKMGASQDSVNRALSRMDLTWKTDDAAIARYDDGILTGISEGETVLRAVSADGKISAEAKVIVHAPVQTPEDAAD